METNIINFRSGTLREKVYKGFFQEKKTPEVLSQELGVTVFMVKNCIRSINLFLGKKQIPMEKTEIVIPKVQETIVSSDKPETINYCDMSKFVPETNGYIERKISGKKDITIFEQAYANRLNILICGETGTGKTHAVRHFAVKNKIPYARVNLNGGTTADELIGHWVPEEKGGFKWQDGLLTIFVRNGGVIALDEVNACPADILFVLHSLLDDERLLVLTSKDGEVVKANQKFMMVCTMNPDYEGTKPLNQAFRDRFQVKLVYDYDEKIESKLIANEKLLEIAKSLRVMYQKGEIITPISTRLLIQYMSNCNIFGEDFAIETFLNSFAIYERDAIKNVVELVFNRDTTPATGVQNGN